MYSFSTCLDGDDVSRRRDSPKIFRGSVAIDHITSDGSHRLADVRPNRVQWVGGLGWEIPFGVVS